MSVENREFDQYMEYQAAQRARRVETLGGAVTTLVLSTVDLGISPVADPETHVSTPETTILEPEVAMSSSSELRRRQLGRFAAESAELGYGLAA